MDFIDEYNTIVSLQSNVDDKFNYYIIKANLEYRLDEIVLCRESLIQGLKYIKYSDKSMMSLLQLTCICGEVDILLKVLKEDENNFLRYEFTNIFVKGFTDIFKSLIYKDNFNVKEFLNLSNSNVEKSIACYLIGRLIDSKDIKAKCEYYKLAIQLWKDNLAAGSELFEKGYKIPIDSIRKLVIMNKIKEDTIQFKENKKDMDFEFIPLGGGSDIGASSYYLRIQDLKVLVDAGVKIKGNSMEYPNYELLRENNLINNIDYLIITHAHLDHCGSILELFKLNKKLKSLMTRETKELLKLNLKSQGLRHQQLYDLDTFLEKSMIINFNDELHIKNKGVSIELYKAGHILGAASIMFRSKSGNVFFTGDFCLRNQNTMEGLQLPIDDEIDVLITETTYGDKEFDKSAIHEYGNLQKYIRDKIKEGKRVLIPSFAIGRAQEILSIIKPEGAENNFRIYIDGSAVKATEIYEKFTRDNLKEPFVYFVDDSFYDSKEDFIKQEIMNNRCCIISSSGMLLEGSASSEYAKQILQDPSGVCILTGYQAADTIGAKLKEQMELKCEKYITIDQTCYKIRSELVSFNLSAHSDVNEIIAVELYLKAKNIILIHGEYKNEPRLIDRRLEKFKNINVYQSINNKLIKL